MNSLDIKLPWRLSSILALGADMKRGFALGKEGRVRIFFSRDPLSSLEDVEDFRDIIVKEMERAEFIPEKVVCDLHPLYFSSRLAEEFSLKIVKVQHHKAHIASVIGEYGLEEEVIGVSMDGTGYGEDGAIWGGEFFVGAVHGLRRVGHIRYFPLQGGDASARETWRPALALLDLFSRGEANRLAEKLGERAEVVLRALRAGLGTVPTSSAGRLFDAAAFLILGIRENEYEAQGPIELEKAAAGSVKRGKAYPFEIKDESELILDPVPAFQQMLRDQASPQEKAFSFHLGLGMGIAEMVKVISRRTGIKKVALSGGVFQNRLLTGIVSEKLREGGFTPFFSGKIPAHDGGIALGQAVLGGLP